MSHRKRGPKFDPRPARCSPCGKVSHPDRASARRAARALRRDDRPGAVLSAYRCPHNADRFHIGHDREREAAAHAATIDADQRLTDARARDAAAQRRRAAAQIAAAGDLGPRTPTRKPARTPPSEP